MTLPDERIFPILERWIFLVLMLSAGLVWGMKLEGRIDSTLEQMRGIDSRVTDLDKTLARGILPLAEERLIRLGNEVRVLQSDVHAMRVQLDKLTLDLERRKLGLERSEPPARRR